MARDRSPHGKGLGVCVRTTPGRRVFAAQSAVEALCITRYYTDGWSAYERHVEPEQHTVGKENTQKIESKHTNLRTRIKRLVRRTICFSKTERMHDLVIGLFINRYEFGRAI
jgi:insertion element IS1 protein InsB